MKAMVLDRLAFVILLLRNEKWKRIRFKKPTKRAYYEISNQGRIKSIMKRSRNEKLLSGSQGNRGFITLNIRLEDNSNARVFIHKFVAEKFVKAPRKDQTYVLHKDYEKSNNKTSNLKWASEAVWKKHLAANPNRKERVRNSKNFKLNEKKVIQIRKMLAKGKTKRSIALKYKVTETQIRRIETRENWAHVKDA